MLQHFQYAVTGIWKSLWRERIQAGFVETGAIPNDAGRTKALIMPFPFALSQTVIRALTEYVKSGGTLISEACPGRFSNHGMAFEGAMAPGIAELFGAKPEGAFLIREPGKGAKWTNWQFSLRDTRISRSEGYQRVLELQRLSCLLSANACHNHCPTFLTLWQRGCRNGQSGREGAGLSGRHDPRSRAARV